MSSLHTTQLSQVEIRERPVSWRFCRSDYGPTRVFYDELHEEIILITAEFVCKSHRASSKLNKFNMRIANHHSLLQAKFSPNNQFIGLQIGPSEIKIIDLKGTIICIQQCRHVKKGNKIRDFHWVSSNVGDICIVTSHGVELYELMSNSKEMRISKSLRYEVRYHWYLPQKQFLMLVNSSYVFQGIRITQEKTEKINKFEIVGVQHITSKNESLFFEQITLVNLNDNIGCIFVDHRKAKIYIFKVQRTEMQLEFDYNLYSQGKYAIFHVDNVLVAYNRNTEMPILIDFDGSNYISAPLPITMCFNTQRARSPQGDQNNNNNNNNKHNNDGNNSNDKPKLRKIFTTQTPNENRELNRHSKQRHRGAPAHEPPPPNSNRGYIVHSKKIESVQKAPNQRPMSQQCGSQSQSQSSLSPRSSQSQSQSQISQQQQQQQQMNAVNNQANLKKIVSNKKYRFITPLFILEVWHEKHAVNSDSNSNNIQYIQYDIGNFYTLSLNLDAIVHSWGSARDRQLPLLNFLLNRDVYQSKEIILKMLFEMIEYYCLGYKYDVRSKLDCISQYFVTINQVLRRAVEESTILAQKQREEQLLAQQKQEQSQQKQSASLRSRIRRTTSALAPRLFGGADANDDQSTLASVTSAASSLVSSTYESSNFGFPQQPQQQQQQRQHGYSTPHSILPPPPQLGSSKSSGNVIGHVPLPAPTHHGVNNMGNANHTGGNIHVSGGGSGRRVAPNVKYDLQKTSQNETVIQATELLEHVFYRINDLIDQRQRELDVMSHEGCNIHNINNINNINNLKSNNDEKKTDGNNKNDNNNDDAAVSTGVNKSKMEKDASYTDLQGLSKKEALMKMKNDSNNNNNNNKNNNEQKDSLSIMKADHETLQKVKKRFIAILIEYTRTMHRMRLKLPISISMLLIKLLRKSHQLYTLHQLFQYHAFPDDEKLAMELLDIAASYGALKSGSGKSNNEENNSNDDSNNNDNESVDSRQNNREMVIKDNGHLTSKQLGIDMLLRLGHWSKICRILLNEGEIYSGVRLFLEKYPFDKKSNTEHLQLSDFLHAAMNKDPICFYHLYNGLNMIISSHHSMFHYYSNIYQSFTTQGNTNQHNIASPRSPPPQSPNSMANSGNNNNSNNSNNNNNSNNGNNLNVRNRNMASNFGGNVKPNTMIYSKSEENISHGMNDTNSYEYNHDSTITNLSLLFSQELMTFQTQFDALHSNFSQ